MQLLKKSLKFLGVFPLIVILSLLTGLQVVWIGLVLIPCYVSGVTDDFRTPNPLILTVLTWYQKL